MAGNTLLPNVAWVVFRVDQDLVRQRPSPAHSRERHPPPAMLADAVTFFVSSATMYAAPTPAPPRSGVAGSLAALSRDLEEPVSPQYQATNRDIGLTAPNGANASAPDARREPSTPAALTSPAFLLAGAAPAAARRPHKLSLRRTELPAWYQAANLQYRLSPAVIDADAQPTRPRTTSIASHRACLGSGIPIHIRPPIHQRIAQQKSQSSVTPANMSVAEPQARATDKKRPLDVGLALRRASRTATAS
jgi:hypothetical protein